MRETMPNLDVSHFRINILQNPDLIHEIVKVHWGDGRTAEIAVSPTGRSVRVYVDGVRMVKEDTT